jgi:hypothetical protein
LRYNCDKNNIINARSPASLDQEYILAAMALIESQCDSMCCRVIAHPILLAHLKVFPIFNESTCRDKLLCSLEGHISHSDVYSSIEMPQDCIIFTGVSEFTGYMPVHTKKISNTDSEETIKTIYCEATDEWEASIYTNLILSDNRQVAIIQCGYIPHKLK